MTLWSKRESCVCPMRHSGHNCCVPAVDPFHTGLNMPLQRILLSLLSLFEHAMLKSSVLALLFTVKIVLFFWP